MVNRAEDEGEDENQNLISNDLNQELEEEEDEEEITSTGTNSSEHNNTEQTSNQETRNLINQTLDGLQNLVNENNLDDTTTTTNTFDLYDFLRNLNVDKLLKIIQYIIIPITIFIYYYYLSFVPLIIQLYLQFKYNNFIVKQIRLKYEYNRIKSIITLVLLIILIYSINTLMLPNEKILHYCIVFNTIPMKQVSIFYIIWKLLMIDFMLKYFIFSIKLVTCMMINLINHQLKLNIIYEIQDNLFNLYRMLIPITFWIYYYNLNFNFYFKYIFIGYYIIYKLNFIVKLLKLLYLNLKTILTIYKPVCIFIYLY